jgi:hypothetical protein
MIADVEPRCKHEELLYERGLASIENKREIAGPSEVGTYRTGRCVWQAAPPQSFHSPASILFGKREEDFHAWGRPGSLDELQCS